MNETPTSHILTGTVESIAGNVYKPELAKLGVKDTDGGFSLLSIPTTFAQSLKLGDRVSVSVVVL